MLKGLNDERKFLLKGIFLLICLLIFSVPTVFAQGPCTVDADCDDGIFCNGTETCVASVCQPGTDPCAPLGCDEEDSATWNYLVCVVDPPITYQFDFNGDEVWDTEWCLEMGETVDVAIWIDDYNLPEVLWGSAWFFMNYDDNYLQVNAENSYIYDTNNGGPWAPGFSWFDDIGDGGIVFELRTGNPWGGVLPTDGKVKLAVIQLERIGATPPPGDAQIGTEDGIVINYAGRGFKPADADATIYYCDDGNVCTADSCDPGTGACIHDPIPHNGNPCDDGDACTTADTCAGGACAGGAAPECDDGNICTDDSCNPASGCINANNTAPCDDGNACTTADTCAGGSCAGGAPPDCDDGNICTDDSCDPASGCINANNSAPCDDSNACTTADTCAGGACAGGSAPNCDDGDVCTDDSCNPASGCVNANNTAPCDDGALCTVNDTCDSGSCSGSPVNCSSLNDQCHMGAVIPVRAIVSRTLLLRMAIPAMTGILPQLMIPAQMECVWVNWSLLHKYQPSASGG